MVHVSLPIQILPLFPLLNQTQHLVITLQHQADIHKNTSSGGFLKTLKLLALERYRIIESKFNTIRFFYSDPKNESRLAELDVLNKKILILQKNKLKLIRKWKNS